MARTASRRFSWRAVWTALMILTLFLTGWVAEQRLGADDKADIKLAQDRNKSANNMKQIMLAMHNYLSVYNTFPTAATYSKDGKPLLSWRVTILPFIEEEQLYKEFKQDEPWDSEHNKKLLARMPKIYAPVRGKTKEENSTFYQGFVGKGAAFEGMKGMKVGDFPDGLSNTLMIAEAGEAVPWSKPADLVFDAEKELPKLGGLFDGNFQAGLGDGSVRFFTKKINDKTLRALITRNGGEVIQP